jgi:pantetheine-phosphate adenylyltransferase
MLLTEKHNSRISKRKTNMRVAVTGGIGAGKSTFCEELKKRLPMYLFVNVDNLVAELYEELKNPIYEDVRKIRDDLMRLTGTIERSLVAELCTIRPDKLKEVEALFAPYLKRSINDKLHLKNVVMEFPLLVETGMADDFDYVINIEADKRTRKHRVSPRPGMTDDKFEMILNRQASDEERRGIADYTIVNDALDNNLAYHVDFLAIRINTYGKRVGIVSGSFDPITNGHLHIIRKGLKLLDHIVVVVANNPTKKTMFTVHQRIQMIKFCLPHVEVSVIALPPSKFVVDFAESIEATYIIRGLRNSTDFEYEHQIDLVQKKINQSIETLFFITPRELTEVSSSMVKSLCGLDGWEEAVKDYVPPVVLKAMKER